MKLKKYLTDRRKRHGSAYTARQFAHICGITESHLSRIVSGKYFPSLRLLRKIIEETNGEVGFDDFAAS